MRRDRPGNLAFAWNPALEWPGWGLCVTFTGARGTLQAGHIPKLLPVDLMPHLTLSASCHLQGTPRAPHIPAHPSTSLHVPFAHNL